MHHGCHLNALAEAGGTLAASAGPATNEIARDITMPTVAVFLHMSCGPGASACDPARARPLTIIIVTDIPSGISVTIMA
jgi:hypothetical protein